MNTRLTLCFVSSMILCCDTISTTGDSDVDSEDGACADVTCGNGYCEVVGEEARCECDPGYRAEGLECVAVPVPVPDETAPVLNSFSVTLASPSRVTISWSTNDTGGSHLGWVEIHRAPDLGDSPGAWQELSDLRTDLVALDIDSHTDSATDFPDFGTWWYGIRIVDQAGNFVGELEYSGGPQSVVVEDTTAVQMTDPQFRFIELADVAPSDYVLQDNYGGIGMDSLGWVYTSVDGYYSNIDIEDTAIFRYNTLTEEIQFLGTMRAISDAENNLNPGEEIAKIHAGIYEHNGSMYFASHSFHDPEEHHRGGHLYSFDLTTEEWTDLSTNDPEGVSAPGEGIITMDILRANDMLAGLTYPQGNIVLFDLESGRTVFRDRPLADDPWNVSRHILATTTGKVYFTYPSYDTQVHVLDVETLTFSRMDDWLVDYGWLAGATQTADGSRGYLLSWEGTIYEIDIQNETFTNLGRLLEEEAYNVNWIHGLTLSADERKLYAFPRTDEAEYALYEFDIQTRTGTNLGNDPSIRHHIVGATTDAQGRIYFFSGHQEHVRLVQVYSE